MPEFNLDDLRFPASPDQLITQGDDMTITIKINGIGLNYPIMHDMNKAPYKLTIVDYTSRIVSVNCNVVEVEEDIRHQTGDYTFEANFNTKNLAKGDLRVIGRVYNLRGEPIPVRQLHRIV